MAPEVDAAILKVADVVGGLMEFWGFKRNMGRMWCVLYLEDHPLAAADLAERLSLSAGAVSMTLSDLSRWGVVKKAWVPGERRDYYEPETNIWKMVSRVFRERELQQIRAAVEAFDDAIAALSERKKAAKKAEAAHLSFALNRIRGLKGLAEIGRSLLEAILEGKAIDAAPIARFRSGE